MLSFGQRLKLIRKEAQVTQAELAEKLMVSVQAISKWECDTSMPDISLLVPLAAILGVTTDCLLGVGGDEKADREKLYAQISEIWANKNVYSYENNAYYESYVLYKEHLKKYPLDYAVKLNCARSIDGFIYSANRYCYKASQEEEDSLYDEEVNLLTAIINYDRDTTRLIEAKEQLIMAYLYRNEFSKAESVAVDLPDRGCIKDKMLMEIYHKKNDNDKCLEISERVCFEAVDSYLASLWVRARRISIYGNARKQEAISAWRDLLAAIKLNHGIFNNSKYMWWTIKGYTWLSNDYIAISDFENTFIVIEELTDILVEDYKKAKEAGDIARVEKLKSNFWFYMHWCYNKCFPTSDNIIANDPRFKKCEERLAALD